MMGQRFVQLLDGHPDFRLELLFCSERNAGKVYGKAVSWQMEDEIPPDISESVPGEFDPSLLEENEIDLVFSALPGNLQRDMEAEAAGRGFPVFSNSAAHRMDANVPILIPEVNADHLTWIRKQDTYPGGFIVTNPNCSTAGLVMALKPIIEFEPRRVFVSTYQAISGAGYPGPPSVTMLGNIVPFIEKEEEKMERETSKILGKKLPVHPSCTRVPVRNGHLLSVNVEMGIDARLEDIQEAFESLEKSEGLHSSPERPVIIVKDRDRPQPLKDASGGFPVKGMSVSVGRIRKRSNVLSFFALVNNTIRGGAGNAILSAELALREGFIGGGRD
jgi:aspartate-semialdehyde dehydrogenase